MVQSLGGRTSSSLEGNYKYLYGTFIILDLKHCLQLGKSMFFHKVCYFGVWQLKVVRERSDFPVTPTICFIPMFTKAFAHFSVHGDEAVTIPPCQQKERASFLSMPLPLPSPLLSILLSVACVTGQGAGIALSTALRPRRRGRRRKLGQGRRFHPLLMVLRSASTTSIRHVGPLKVSLFPPGWLVCESLPHNIEKLFLKVWEMHLDSHEI